VVVFSLWVCILFLAFNFMDNLKTSILFGFVYLFGFIQALTGVDWWFVFLFSGACFLGGLFMDRVLQ